MFKHVEHMRKKAINIMSKTFGGRSKDKNEAIYDAYPLRDLVRLLCFEDMNEARNACHHFGITVREVKVRTSAGTSMEEIIFWRQSSFKEPEDADKGTIIPLPPQKMNRTIESKLMGATRLAVCRGEVSGDGAFIDGNNSLQTNALRQPVKESLQFDSRNAGADADQASRDLREQRTETASARLEEEKRHAELVKQRLEKEEKKRQQAEALRREEERRRMEEQERKRAEDEIQRQEQERRAKLAREEHERKEQFRREQERLEREQEAIRARQEEERRIRQIELERQEQIRLAKEKAFEEEREKQRAIEERKRQLEELERKRLQAEETERRRKEEESRLLERRKRELKDRKEKEAYEQRMREVARIKADLAKKKLLWRRLCSMMPKSVVLSEAMSESLSRIDPTLASRPPANNSIDVKAFQPEGIVEQVGLRRILESLLKEEKRINIASLIAEEYRVGKAESQSNSQANRACTTLLLTVDLVVPFVGDACVRSLSDLARRWIVSRIGAGLSSVATENSINIRVALLQDESEQDAVTPDVALVALPGPWCGSKEKYNVKVALELLGKRLHRNVPTVFLAMSDQERFDNPADLLERTFKKHCVIENEGVSKASVENALHQALLSVASFLRETKPHVFQRMPIYQLCLRVAIEAVWQDIAIEERDEILEHIRVVLGCLVDELEATRTVSDHISWPHRIFAPDGLSVPGFFGDGLNLPLDWQSTFGSRHVEPVVFDVCELLSGSMREVLTGLVKGAPGYVQRDCLELLDKRLFRECLNQALLWKAQHLGDQEMDKLLFLPEGKLGDIVVRTLRRAMQESPLALTDTNEDTEKEIVACRDVQPLQQVPYRSHVAETPTESPIITSKENGKQLSAFDLSRSEFKRPAKRFRNANYRQSYPPEPNEKYAYADLKESKAFTRRLEALVRGETIEMLIGDKPLSLLLRNAPTLEESRNAN